MTEDKTYLGDAVYVAWDGMHVVLTTEDGIEATNTIYLEPWVYEALERWVNAFVRKPKDNS